MNRCARSLIALIILLHAGAACAESGEPIPLKWSEGDFAGATTIWTPDGKGVQGYSAYRQHREGDRLIIEKTAYYSDGSRDEDKAVVRVGSRLESISGRTRIVDAKGKPTLDLTVDVAKRRITGFFFDDGERTAVDDEFEIGAGTYWTVLFNFVVKNFEANAKDGKFVFQALVVTPKPRIVDMELSREGTVTISRTGGTVKTDRLTLLPTLNLLLDPIIQGLAPRTEFFVESGTPPAVMRFDGPRNYAGRRIRIE